MFFFHFNKNMASQDEKQEGTETPTRKRSMADDFFRGSIKDSTTKESRKADHALAILRTLQRNPQFVPVDNISKKVKTMSQDEISKLSKHSSLSMSAASSALSATPRKQASSYKSPMLSEVEADIHRRIHALGEAGQRFEPNASFRNDPVLAADAEYLVQVVFPLFFVLLLLTRH